MPGILPLCEGWTLQGEHLPSCLMETDDAPVFTLPGAQELSAFADLLGIEPQEDAAGDPPGAASAPLCLPALLPEDMPGTAELSQEIDLRLCGADWAQVCFAHLAGRGEALIDGRTAASFDHGPLTLDLSPLLGSSDAHTLTLRFDSTRPAGVCGPVTLRTAAAARLEQLHLHADEDGTAVLRVRIHALKTGCYQLRVLPCPADGAQAAAQPPLMRESAYTLAAGGRLEAEMAFPLPGEAFTPGRPGAAPSVRIWLWREGKQLCDGRTLLCGRPGKPPRAYVPLSPEDLRTPPEALCDALRGLHIHAVSTLTPVSEALAHALLAGGIHLRIPHAAEECTLLERFPNISSEAPSRLTYACGDDDALCAAWSLGGMTDHPRRPDPDALPAELLADLAGRRLDPAAAEAQDVLAWLRAVSVRLAAEAFVQGRLSGPLCAPGAWQRPDVADALRIALAPVHLSALPLYGAWWTLSRFSASLYAVAAPAQLPAAVRQSGEPVMALASLEDEEGNVLASFEGACPNGGGPIGTLSALLPEQACALTLHTRLVCGGAVIEQSDMPVYIGDRGLLEAAFAAT